MRCQGLDLFIDTYEVLCKFYGGLFKYWTAEKLV